MKLCGFDVGLDRPFFLIAGPCVIESEQLQMDGRPAQGDLCRSGHSLHLQEQLRQGQPLQRHLVPRPRHGAGLEILAEVRRELDVPMPDRRHTEAEIPMVASVVDVLQTPAFLCRQTDFIRAVAPSDKPVNIKKGQFLAPHDEERGRQGPRRRARGRPGRGQLHGLRARASFGYNNLVSDMRSLAIMRETGARWCSMPPTPCSCPAGRAPAAAACARWCRCWRARRSPSASPASVHGNPPRPAPMRCRTAPTPCRCAMKALLETLVALDS